MAIATRGTASNYLQRAPSPSGLADVVDVILDKGLVIDAYVRVSVIGIEVVTIDARIVVASVTPISGSRKPSIASTSGRLRLRDCPRCRAAARPRTPRERSRVPARGEGDCRSRPGEGQEHLRQGEGEGSAAADRVRGSTSRV